MPTVRFSVILEWDEEETMYMAFIPALEMHTHGRTRSEALDEAREGIVSTIQERKESARPIPNGDGEKVVVVEVEV